jgi:hypothetical protein
MTPVRRLVSCGEARGPVNLGSNGLCSERFEIASSQVL